MLTILPFPTKVEINKDETRFEVMRHHPDVEDVLMDELEDEGESAIRSKLTSPGYSITSAQAFMRQVLTQLITLRKL